MNESEHGIVHVTDVVMSLGAGGFFIAPPRLRLVVAARVEDEFGGRQ